MSKAQGVAKSSPIRSEGPTVTVCAPVKEQPLFAADTA